MISRLRVMEIITMGLLPTRKVFSLANRCMWTLKSQSSKVLDSAAKHGSEIAFGSTRASNVNHE
jgi:hypothetical protein